jgi:hypothetical protein
MMQRVQKFTENTAISLSLMVTILISVAWGAWNMSELHRDIEGLKRIAIAQMGSRWRCNPDMAEWAVDLEKLNPELIVPRVKCEDDTDILNFTEPRKEFPYSYP